MSPFLALSVNSLRRSDTSGVGGEADMLWTWRDRRDWTRRRHQFAVIYEAAANVSTGRSSRKQNSKKALMRGTLRRSRCVSRYIG